MKVLLLGGTDTLAITLEWAMLELVRHPNVMQRLQLELDSKLEVGQHIEEDLASQLPYLQVKIYKTNSFPGMWDLGNTSCIGENWPTSLKTLYIYH